MITLLSLRLRNFRKIEEATFRPLADGITGLSGENGSGKSSFLYGAVWALFGVRPAGVPVSGLRRQQSDIKDECSVSVLLQHEGQVIEVIREIAGKSNRTTVNIFVDGEPQTITSIGVADKWITDRLGVDANGFATAFVVRQKELDALISARPADRRVAIERLSGIERMSEAVKSARQAEILMKREVDVLPGSEEDVALAEETVKERQATLDNIIIEGEEQLAALKAEISELESNHQTLLEQSRIYTSASNEIAMQEAQSNSLAEELTTLHADLDALPEIETQARSLEEVTEAGKALTKAESDAKETQRALQAESRTTRDALTTAKSGLDHTNKTLQSYRIDLQKLSSLDYEADALKDEIKNAETVASELESEMNTAETNARVCRDQRNQSTQTLKILKNNLGDSHCPMCKHHLDDPSKLVEEIETQINTLQGKEAGWDDERKTLLTKLTFQRETKRKAEESLHTILVQQSRLAHRATEVEELEQAAAAYETQIEELSPKLEAIDKKIVESEAELNNIETQLVALREEYRDASRNQDINERRTQINNRINERQKAKEDVDTALTEKKTTFNALPVVTNNDIDAAYAALKNKEQEALQIERSIAEQQKEFALAKERLNSAEKELDHQKALIERKRTLLDTYAEKVAVVDLLDEFRKDRIARIAPELSETATNLISQMTSGRFTEITLDEEFTPTIIDSEGVSRPAAWLSGGEESAVALALRIAIGDLMTGGQGGLLWLDEVLTAQDAERRSSLINTLRSTSGRQIIMINHTVDAADMVDKVIKVDTSGNIVEQADEYTVTNVEFSE